MAPVYATKSDLESFLGGETVDNADRLLKMASMLVDSLLIGAVYETDDQQQPTDSDVADTLLDATVLQAAYWHENGEPIDGASRFGNVNIGSVSLSRGETPKTASTDGQTVAPGVQSILHVAGLVPVTPYVRG